MKYGHIRGAGGRRNVSMALTVPSSNSLKITNETPVQLIEQTDKEQVQPEIVWTRARVNLIIL